MLIDRLWETIQEKKLIEAGEIVVVGVSGGPDSMALLHGLWRLASEGGWQVAAVHVDHQLRETSILDAEYVQARCHEWKIPLEIYSIDVPNALQEAGGNLQATARKLRYEAFRDAAEKFKAQKIALAHHADDQVETMLMRLIRGTGVGGLTGIPLRRPLYEREVIRPLLEVTRKEIESYCSSQGLDAREDESNRSLRYTRNRIRLELVPELESYNPQFKQMMLNLAQVISDEEEVWAALVEETASHVIKEQGTKEVKLDLRKLSSSAVALQRRVIKLILSCLGQHEADFSLDTVEQIRSLALQEAPSGSLDLPGGFVAVREYNVLHLFQRELLKEKVSFSTLIAQVPGETYLPDGRCLVAQISPTSQAFDRLATTAVFDADLLTEPLLIRTRQPGDRMQPMGLNGSKKVKEIFIDRKVPRRLRDHIPLIVHGSQIIWIPGVCRSSFAPVTAETKRFLYLRWYEKSE